MRMMIKLFLAASCLAACASTPDGSTDVYDPLEPLNRNVTGFNNTLDEYALGPLARGYEMITPEILRNSITNVSRNLNEPVTFANDVLQGEPNRAADSFFRFFINSTVGLVGLWDPAEKMGLERHTEDFGQTLAVWGVSDGAYLVLPGLGPSNVRDAFGRVVDTAAQPTRWLQFGNDIVIDFASEGSLGLASGLNSRAKLDDAISQLNDQPEPYVALKRLYSSQRQADIRNGIVDEETQFDDLPDFDDF